MNLKFRSKFNHGFTNHGYLHSAVWKALYNFNIKRAQESIHNQLFFQNVQNNEIFEIFKMFKNNSWINVYYTKSKRLISLSWNFVPRLIQVYRTPWGCLLFLFSTGNTFLGKFGPKNQNCQFELKFRTRLIWTCRIILKICAVHFFCFRPEKPFLDKSGKKNQNCQQNLVPRD